MANGGDVPARGFLSYTRDDNDDFDGAVDVLKKQLQGRFRAHTGRGLEIFVDRDSIGWGAEWRSKIRESVESATFFVPVVTARYFQSDACREELLAFYQNAKRLNVTVLILPIILSGVNGIRADDPRDEVQLIESLNYKNLEQAWLAGYESSEWRRALAAMVVDLSNALNAAEAALGGRESASAVDSSSGVGEEENETVADAGQLTVHLDELTPVGQAAQASMQAFVEATGSAFEVPDGVTNSQRQAAYIRASKPVQAAAEEFEQRASEYEVRTLQIDAEIRAVLEALEAIPGEQSKELAATVRSAFANFPDISEGMQSFDTIFSVLELASLTNVSLRKAMAPAIRASRSLRNALSTAQSWASL